MNSDVQKAREVLEECVEHLSANIVGNGAAGLNWIELEKELLKKVREALASMSAPIAGSKRDIEFDRLPPEFASILKI